MGSILDERNVNPSYGMAVFSRIQCQGARFFGSDITHDTAIMLTITNAEECVNDAGFTRYHSKETVTTVYFTPSQFASLLTNMNTSGVPCTFRHKIDTDGKLVAYELPQSKSKSQRIKDAVRTRAGNLIQTVRDLNKRTQELLNAKTITKSEFKVYAEEVRQIQVDIETNLPWYAEVIQEQVDKTVSDAKASIEDFAQLPVERTGLDALNKMKQLKHLID
jgi:hypothetical protein